MSIVVLWYKREAGNQKVCEGQWQRKINGGNELGAWG